MPSNESSWGKMTGFRWGVAAKPRNREVLYEQDHRPIPSVTVDRPALILTMVIADWPIGL
jgi:hypothetical protein